jgi:glucuronoarabinoxylan endo-1,4-beta-xylanase
MRMRRSVGRLMLAVSLACALGTQAQTNITVTPSTEYQTIEGLGGYACFKEATERSGPFYIPAPMDRYYDSLAYDLGISMVRFELSPAYWPTEGGQYNPGGDVFCGPISKNITHMQQMAARGVNRFVWTVWSPPGWMKPSGSATGPAEGAPSYSSTQSKLDPAHYTDFGNFMRDYLIHMETNGGVTPYALSIANEPRFTQPFNNCVWDPPSYRDGLKVVGPIVKARFPNIRFFGTEAMFWEVNSWLPTICGDATATQYLNAVAGHYGSASDYSSTYTQANSYGKALWGSEEETDEDHTGVSAALTQAGRLHYALAGGSASAWIGWTIGEFTPGDNTMRAPHWIWTGAKHFFRFVRPNAKRIGCSGGTSSLKVSAYKHTGDNTVTVVVVNTGGAASISLQGSGLPTSFTKFQTDATNRCVSQGSVQTSSSISIPGSGIVTLYSGDITSIFNHSQPAQVRAIDRARTGRATAYTLDGRRSVLGTNRAPANGVRVIRDDLGAHRSMIMEQR